MDGEKVEGSLNMSYEEHPDFLTDWKTTVAESDGCTSYLAKYVAKALLWLMGSIRNYGCDCCRQHDFYFRFGPKYGITFTYSNEDLRYCVLMSGHIWCSEIMYSFVSGPIGRYVWNNYRKKYNQLDWIV